MAEAGLLNAKADLRVLALVLRDFDNLDCSAISVRRTSAQAALMDDARAFSALSALYSCRASLSRTTRGQNGAMTANVSPEIAYSQPHAFGDLSHGGSTNPSASPGVHADIPDSSLPPNGMHTLVHRLEMYECGSFAQSRPSCGVESYSVTTEACPGATRALRDIGRGLLVLVVPHLRLPWAADLAAAIWRTFGVRLDRRGAHSAPTQFASTIDEIRKSSSDGLDVLAKDFYPSLSPEDQRYNAVVAMHLQKLHGVGAVAKIANLVRLSYVNGVLNELRPQIVKASIQRDDLHAELKALGDAPLKMSAGRCSRRVSKRPREVSSSCTPPKPREGNASDGVLESQASRAKCRFGLAATPVATATGHVSVVKYIVNGSVVPASIIHEFGEVLASEFLIELSLVDTASFRGSMPCRASRLTHGVAQGPVVSALETYRPSSSTCESTARLLGSKTSAFGGVESHTQIQRGTSLDVYLQQRFGCNWRQVSAHAIGAARHIHLERNLERLEQTVRCLGMAEDAAQAVKDWLVRAAVVLEVENAPLSLRCAFALVQSLPDREVNPLYNRLPREAFGLVAAARNRLEELESAESLSIQSLALRAQTR